MKCVFPLRVGLSPLRSHKKHYNFVDTPTDWCDCNSAPEDTRHFLFHCKFYEAQRYDLLSAVTPLLLDYPNVYVLDNTDLFLYGHHSLKPNISKQILLYTIRFIKETGRFNTWYAEILLVNCQYCHTVILSISSPYYFLLFCIFDCLMHPFFFPETWFELVGLRSSLFSFVFLLFKITI